MSALPDAPAVTLRATFRFDVPGAPRGQGRPRITTRGGRPRTFTDPKTEGAADMIRWAWRDAGAPVLPAGPYALRVVAQLGRPRVHFLQSGDLSAAGLRSPLPTRRPDIDNVCKLALDALVSVGAIPDDAALVDLAAMKEWALPEIGPRLVVIARTLEGGGPA